MEQFKSDIKYALTTNRSVLNTLLKYRYIKPQILNNELIKICTKYIRENKFYLAEIDIDTNQTRVLQHTLIVDIIQNKDITNNLYDLSFCDKTETFLTNNQINRLICKATSYLHYK